MPLDPDELQQEINKIEEEEKKERDSLMQIFDPEKLVENIAKQASQRLQGGTSGKLAVLLATLLLAINNVAVGWLQGEGVLTEDVIIILLIGLILFVTFQGLNHVNNYISLRLHKKDLELDIQSLKVKEKDAQIRVAEMGQKYEIIKRNMVAQRLEARADMKFKQDLELRVPLYQEAQHGMMQFFAREDITQALQVPASFADAIKRMDDILFQRIDVDLTMSDLTEKFAKMIGKYDQLTLKVDENAHVLNALMQQEATNTVKYRELQLKVDSLQESMQIAIKIMDERLPPNGTPIVMESDDGQVKTKTTIQASDMQSEINQLVDEMIEKEEEKKDPPTTSTLSPPPSG